MCISRTVPKVARDFSQNCPVGCRSLLRSLCSFYKLLLTSFIASQPRADRKTAVEKFVETKLLPGCTNKNFCSTEDLATAIRLLLNAKFKSKQPTNVPRRPYKLVLHPYIVLPSTSHSKIQHLKFLLSNTTMKKLNQFLDENANNFLMTYFVRNGGLEQTDPLNDRPDCR